MLIVPVEVWLSDTEPLLIDERLKIDGAINVLLTV